MDLPPGTEMAYEKDVVCRLQKALYGLKQSVVWEVYQLYEKVGMTRVIRVMLCF